MEVPLKKVIFVFLITIASASYDYVVKPEFGEKARDLNITSFAGQTSRLPCTVKHLSGKRVSWIRQRDLQVLSTGRTTFSTGLRISVLPGTRFKLRKPRDLLTQDYLPRLVSNRTNGNTREPTNEEQMLSSPHWLSDGESERQTPLLNQSQFSTTVVLARVDFYGSKKEEQEEEEEEEADHPFPPNERQGGVYQRKVRSTDHKHHKRQKKYWYRDNRQWSPLNFQQRYTAKRNSRRYKKALTTSIQKHRAFTKAKSLASPAKGQKTERYQAYAKQNNPIAIYPQGPISTGSDAKGLQPAPNYIDGVWEPEDYTLQIKYTKPEDAGIYICQINTEPRISQAVVLRVVKMKAEILGRRELFVKAGNPVRLSCKVNHGALSPGFILWYKGERLVEYEKSGGRIQVMTEAGGVSHLLLRNAQPEDSSNYTCSPAGGAPASLILNVIVDERQAAMQQGNYCPPLPLPSPSALWPVVIFVQLLSYPSDHSPRLTNFLFLGVLIGINFLSSSSSSSPSSFSFLSFVLFLVSIIMGSERCSCCGTSSSFSSTTTSSSSSTSSPLVSPSNTGIGVANLLPSVCCWILAFIKGFPSLLRPYYKANMIRCFIVSMCVFVSIGYISEYL